MTQTLVKELCPHCRSEMHLEARTMLEVVGRNDREVLRYHCQTCRKFFNIPVDERK